MTEPLENVCLKWSDFQQNIGASYQQIRTSEEFSDVTLVAEDGQQIEAHRIVLAACSQFFSTVIRGNKYTHPIIYMRGLRAKDLLAIVDFIYYGEANIQQENLEKFLALGEELKLKGLSTNLNEAAVMLTQPPRAPFQDYSEQSIQVKQDPNGSSDYIIESCTVDEEEVKIEDIAAKIDAMINEKKKQVEDGKLEMGFKCEVCGINCSTIYNLKVHMMRHKRVKSTSCRKCLLDFKDADLLRNHKIKCRLYKCKCGLKAETSSLIKTHREACQE